MHITYFFSLQYHGGTNFGRTAGGPYITTTYDYDAPLDEFGNCIYFHLELSFLSSFFHQTSNFHEVNFFLSVICRKHSPTKMGSPQRTSQGSEINGE